MQRRLTAGMIALLTLASITIAAATALGLRAYLIRQLDRQLAVSGERFEQSLDNPTEEGEDDSAGSTRNPNQQHGELGDVPGLAAGTLAVQLRKGETPTSAYVIASGLIKLDPADAATISALPLGGKPRTAELSRGAYRLVALGTDDNDALAIGIPLASLDETMTRLLVVEAVVFVVVIALAGVAGGLFVGRSLAPLRRVSSTATRVVALPLGSGEVTLPDRVTGVAPGEVGQVAEALNLLLDHVEASFAQRHATEERLRRFVADASHELRTPVAVIRGYTELAQRQPDPVPPAVSQALERIRAQAENMAVLVDDLLLLARLDSGRPLAREEVDLTRLVLDVVDDARVAGRGHRWLLELPEDPVVVTGDEQRLHQILANLTTNARVHTPAGTTVTVSLAVMPGPAGEVAIHVTDDGPGIPAELQPDLFERFVRGAASRSRTAGSTGLGLAIVAAVVAAHGGRVEVASRPGRTRFTLHLPAQRP